MVIFSQHYTRLKAIHVKKVECVHTRLKFTVKTVIVSLNKVLNWMYVSTIIIGLTYASMSCILVHWDQSRWERELYGEITSLELTIRWCIFCWFIALQGVYIYLIYIPTDIYNLQHKMCCLCLVMLEAVVLKTWWLRMKS